MTTSSAAAFRLFDLAFQPWMRTKVHAVRLAVPKLEVGPVLLAANHASWWDGFLVRKLFAAARPGAPLFTVMLERELSSRPWLRRLGAIGLTPGSTASVRHLLREVEALSAQHPSMGLAFFPQGEIWPSGRRPLGFHSGLQSVAQRLQAGSVVPVGLHLEAGNHPTPTAWVAGGGPISTDAPDLNERAEEAVASLLDRTHAFLHAYGEHADEHSEVWRSEVQAERTGLVEVPS